MSWPMGKTPLARESKPLAGMATLFGKFLATPERVWPAQALQIDPNLVANTRAS